MEHKISVVINTYNAEKHLEQVLEAVKDFDEIVVCDMESTDSTLDIARKYNCKIVTFPKKNYNIVEPARNFAVQSAANKWVLVVDADEIITPELKSILYKKISEPNCPAGFFIQRRNKFMGMYIRDFHPEYILRFFIKDGVEWPTYIHSIPVIPGIVEKLSGYNNACMHHLMDETMHEYMAKMNQYTDNEVEKKIGRNYGVGALIWRPVWRFFKKYFMDGSYRMGTRGLIRALMAAVYQFVLISKIIERRYR